MKLLNIEKDIIIIIKAVYNKKILSYPPLFHW